METYSWKCSNNNRFWSIGYVECVYVYAVICCTVICCICATWCGWIPCHILSPLFEMIKRSGNGGLLFFVPAEACCAGRQAMHHQGGGCLCSRTEVDLCFKVLLQLAHVFSLDLIFLFLAAFALQFITVVGSAPWFGELILLPNWRMFHGCNSWVHSEGKAWWTMFAQPSGFCNVWWTGRRTLQKATQRKLENWSFQAN